MRVWQMDLLALAPTQLYISSAKLSRVQEWLTPQTGGVILPVQDFGDGRWALTDGHTRAYHLYRQGVRQVMVQEDTDEIIRQSWRLYQEDRKWCDRWQVNTVADFTGRVIREEAYQTEWIARCRRLDYLMTHFDFDAVQAQHPKLYLIGADERAFYLEDKAGNPVLIERNNKQKE